MKAVVVDDEKLALENLVDIVSSLDSFSSVKGFSNPLEALEYLKKHYADVVFLDVRMPGIDGITLAKEVMEFSPDTNIIFTTAYTHYLTEAFALHASGYILKPVTKDAVIKEVKNLRFPPKRNDLGLRVQTFGRFEVLFDGRLVEFESPKVKELFALLVDRVGGEVGLREISGVLYPEAGFDITQRKEVNAQIEELKVILAEAGQEDVIVSSWGKFCVDRKKFRCDLYEFLDGKPSAMSRFNGCYLTGYEWAEERLPYILRQELKR